MSAEDSASDSARFAAQYAAMSDGELLKLAARSWELSDAAWDVLEDELERRHLELPTPEPIPQIEAPEKRNLVLLRRFRDLPEALLAKGKLESAGVPCFFADDNTVRMDWLWSNLLGASKSSWMRRISLKPLRCLTSPFLQDWILKELSRISSRVVPTASLWMLPSKNCTNQLLSPACSSFRCLFTGKGGIATRADMVGTNKIPLRSSTTRRKLRTSNSVRARDATRLSNLCSKITR